MSFLAPLAAVGGLGLNTAELITGRKDKKEAEKQAKRAEEERRRKEFIENMLAVGRQYMTMKQNAAMGNAMLGSLGSVYGIQPK